MNPGSLATGLVHLTIMLFACIGRAQYRFSKTIQTLYFALFLNVDSKMQLLPNMTSDILIIYLNT